MNQKTKENIQKIAEITRFMEEAVWENDTQERQNHIENVLKSIINEKDFSYENVEHKIRAVNMLYCINRDNKTNNDKGYDTIKRLVGNEKAIAFWENNKEKITKDIKQEAKDYGYTEQDLVNKIYEAQNCKNSTSYYKQIALARYSIYQTAQNFQESIAYGLSEYDYRVATNEVKEYESALTQKMFEIFNKYNKTIEDENRIINLIDKGADVNAKAKDNGDTPLMLACGSYDFDKLGNGNLRIAKFLLENGADVNAKNNDGMNALHIASITSNFEIAKTLIENGADVNLRVSLDDKIFKNHFRTAIHESSRDFNLTKLLIENGANVNAKDMDGKTALHLLTYYGTIDSAGMLKIAKLLIDNGAKINLKDNYGNTALDNVKNFTINPYDKDKEKIENDIKELKSYLIQKGAKMGKEIKISPKSNEKHKASKKQVERDNGMGM